MSDAIQSARQSANDMPIDELLRTVYGIEDVEDVGDTAVALARVERETARQIRTTSNDAKRAFYQTARARAVAFLEEDREEQAPNDLRIRFENRVRPILAEEDAPVIPAIHPTEHVPGTVNPLLRQTVRRTIVFDSQFRDRGMYPHANDYFASLAEKLQKVVLMRLYSYQIPVTWYGVRAATFSIVRGGAAVSTYTIPDGNYTPAQMAAALNDVLGEPVVSYLAPPQKLVWDFGGGGVALPGDVLVWYDPTEMQGSESFGWQLGFRAPRSEVPDSMRLTPPAIASFYGPKYLTIIVDDFNKNHVATDPVVMGNPTTTLSLPHYYHHSLSCAAVDNGGPPYVVKDPNADHPLTDAQVHTINQVLYQQATIAYKQRVIPGNMSDTFAIVPVKKAPGTEILSEFGNSLQDNRRTYFGPVDVERARIRLTDDLGRELDLNGADWSFTVVCELLYQM